MSNGKVDRPASARRRGFLKAAGGAALGISAGMTSRAAVNAAARGGERRVLSFVHTHTNEQLTAAYFDAGEYQNAALLQINVLLRDFRTETVHAIDPAVLDRLFALQSAAGSSEAFQVICGFRSPETNAALRRRSSGVAEHSLHMEGRAIDVRLPGVATGQLAVLARRQLAGGVGFYRVSDFVHVDTGRVRSWGDELTEGS